MEGTWQAYFIARVYFNTTFLSSKNNEHFIVRYPFSDRMEDFISNSYLPNIALKNGKSTYSTRRTSSTHIIATLIRFLLRIKWLLKVSKFSSSFFVRVHFGHNSIVLEIDPREDSVPYYFVSIQFVINRLCEMEVLRL